MFVCEYQTMTKSTGDIKDGFILLPLPKYLGKLLDFWGSDIILPALSKFVITHGVELVLFGPDKSKLESTSRFLYLLAFEDQLWCLDFLSQFIAFSVLKGLNLVV
jgi:hypothetical protein